MLLLKKVLDLPKAIGFEEVASNLSIAFESLGHECLVENWTSDEGPKKELVVTDNAGNVAGITIPNAATADGVRTENPHEVVRYIATTVRGFTDEYNVEVKSPWIIHFDIVNIHSKLDLEPSSELLEIATVEA